jgi:hypothetical protein
LIIGAAPALTENFCPHTEQNTAPSAIAAPHFVQYTLPPPSSATRHRNLQSRQSHRTFNAPDGQPRLTNPFFAILLKQAKISWN